jgi:hypothetical protein
MQKEVLEVDGKRCKFGAIEIGQLIIVFTSPVLRSSVADCRWGTAVPRMFSDDAAAYDSAEQLIHDP